MSRERTGQRVAPSGKIKVTCMDVLTEAMNTYAAAIRELVSLGFRVRAVTEQDADPNSLTEWLASDPEVRLHASSPIGLLGLAAIWRSRRADWRTANRELYDRALSGEVLGDDGASKP